MLKVLVLVILAAALANASYPAANYPSIVYNSVEEKPIHHEETHKALVIPGPLRITSYAHKPASIQVIRHTVHKPAVIRHRPVVVVRRRKPIIKKPAEEYGVPIHHHTKTPFIPITTTTVAPNHEYGLPEQTYVNFNEGGKYPYPPATEKPAVIPVKHIEIPPVPAQEYGPPKPPVIFPIRISELPAPAYGLPAVPAKNVEIPAQQYGPPKPPLIFPVKNIEIPPLISQEYGVPKPDIVQPITYVPQRPEAFGYSYSVYSNPGHYHYNHVEPQVPVTPATEYGPPKEASHPFVPYQHLPLVNNNSPFVLHQYHTRI